MSDSRWFRLNCDWWESEWLYVLSAEAQLAWVKFLGRVKTHGFGGTMKKVGCPILARQWMQGEESIRQMLIAAENAGAVSSTDDAWMVTGWAKYQGDTTNAERQARFKNKKNNGGNALVTAVTTTETETETETSTSNNPPKSPLGGGFVFPPGFEEPARKWAEYRKDNKRKPYVVATWRQKMAEYDGRPEDFARDVAYSIGQGYQGIIPVRDQPVSGRKPPGRQNLADVPLASEVLGAR